MCSFHFAQQPQVGLLNTATLGLPVAVLPCWLLTTATPTPATRTTAEASATAAERIIIMVISILPVAAEEGHDSPWERPRLGPPRGVCVAPGTSHSVAAGWARPAPVAW